MRSLRRHFHQMRRFSSLRLDQPAISQTFGNKIVTITGIDEARSVVRRLKDLDPSQIWACDTEVADIDVKLVGPVGNGKVISFSLFGGDNVDFGFGLGKVLWVDTVQSSEVILEFKDWFEDPLIRKVWHNYGFDRHVLFNEGVNCQGFFGDTMHMARLWNSNRDKQFGGDGYSLESLSSELVQNSLFAKISMKELFGISKTKKDGTDSKIKEIPSVRQLQEDPATRDKWIEYSARDAVATFHVHEVLQIKLKEIPWMVEGKCLGTLLDLYSRYFCSFGELLTDLERRGITVDTKGHLKDAEVKARAERLKMEDIFIRWASKYCSDAKFINLASTAQLQQFFFGGYENKVLKERSKIFKIPKEDGEFEIEEAKALTSNPFLNCTVNELKQQLKDKKLSCSGKREELLARLLEFDFGQGYQVQTNKTSKFREITIETIGLEPEEFTPTGGPQVTAAVLKKLAGKDLFGEEKDCVWGTAFNFFGRQESAKEACRAIGALANIGQIDTTITNFLVPLQALVDSNNRVHCSLNLNTETGRLSSRKPNLQNQPALEKDQYKIRDAFIAAPGCTFIVADYGQLELRVLAHITNCKSMLEAFSSGGCFHSRTAVGMYDYIKQAVSDGSVLLEWDSSKGAKPSCPMVKDVYASERRKAKTLNFSIAYGKTVHGLAADWGISTAEAESTLEAWYKDRPEVREWQDRTRWLARKEGFVRTIMGRYRHLPDAKGRGAMASHALRAAINTPIQGSAADIVMMAMIKLNKSKILDKLGWKLLLQIHDEVIMEGPKESSQEAMAEVLECMENPFDGYALNQLRVHLDVDAKSADSWYKAK